MTDTAKPTQTKWVVERRMDDATRGMTAIIDKDDDSTVAKVWKTDYVDLISEAGNVFHETGLTPRQLLEQRDVYREAFLETLVYGKAFLETLDLEVQENLKNQILNRTALAKHGEVV